jgi:hypothetical protein
VYTWCGDRQTEGKFVDFKVFAALHAYKVRSGNISGRLWY